MKSWIAVADEEPPFDAPFFPQLADERRDDIDEDAVGRRHSAVELREEPVFAREARVIRRQFDARHGGEARNRKRGRLAHHRDEHLVVVGAVDAARAELIGIGKSLAQYDGSRALAGV